MYYYRKGLKELEKLAKEKKMELFKISAATGEGLQELLDRVAVKLKEIPKESLIDEKNIKKVYKLKEVVPFTIRKEGKVFVVEGPAVEKVMRRVNMEDNESYYYFQKELEKLGVNEALRKAGVQDGDTVRIVDYNLDWVNQKKKKRKKEKKKKIKA